MNSDLVLAWRGTWHYPHRDGIYVNCRLTRCGRTVPVESVVITSAASVDPAAICKQCADCTNPPENQEEATSGQATDRMLRCVPTHRWRRV